MFFSFHHDTFITWFLGVGTTTTNGFTRFNAKLLLGFFLYTNGEAQAKKK